MSEVNKIQLEYHHFHGNQNETTRSKGLSPELSNSFLMIDLFILFPVCYLHYMIRRMTKREKEEKGHSLIKNILKYYSNIVPVMFFCSFTYVHIILRYTKPPCKVFSAGFCYVYQILAHSGSIYVGGFSLFCAVVKYVFIVHNAKSREIGEEKIKTFFTLSYCIVPVVMATLNSLSHGSRDQMMWVNLCWGIEPSDMGGNDRNFDLFCIEKKYDTAQYVGIEAGAYLIPFQRVTCAGVNILYMLFLTNIVEFIVYARIFNYLNR